MDPGRNSTTWSKYLQRLVVGDLDTSKLHLTPTWGVSFGLPQGGGGGYPINPYGGDSLLNPYPGYGAGSQGLNLGLVSVNPLVAVQVTKDEYGEKIVKPFVNLHVTPNHGLVHKLGDLLAHKKQILLGKPGGQHYPHYPHHPPHYYPAGPPIYEKPYSHHYPSYSGGYGLAYPGKPHHHYPAVYKPHYSEGPYSQPSYGGGGYYREENDYENDYSGEYGDYAEDYYRNLRGNDTQKNGAAQSYDSAENDWEPTQASRLATNKQDGKRGRVAFPERRKRDVSHVEELAQEVRAGSFIRGAAD